MPISPVRAKLWVGQRPPPALLASRVNQVTEVAGDGVKEALNRISMKEPSVRHL